MLIKRSIQMTGAFLVVLALCAFLYTPARAATRSAGTDLRTSVSNGSPTSVNANVYVTQQMLQPMFRSNLSQAIPQMVGNALVSTIGQLPKQDQGWASQMAGALLQPSATLVSLKPQAGGLLTTIKLDLYPGDPKPMTASILIGLKVTGASTIQVTALPPVNGGQSLVSGPLMTMQVPLGSLNTIHTTPSCGDADLNINLKFPISLGASGQASSGTTPAAPLVYTRSAASALNSYIELPAASLAQLGSSIGSMKVSSSLTAENIRVGVQNSNLLVTSDIHWHGILIGTAVSTMIPGAANGNLVVHVLKTDLQIFGGLISFPVNSYNQQIQQDLNTELNGALQGAFTVTQAAIGPSSHLPCVAATSLVLGGTIALNQARP